VTTQRRTKTARGRTAGQVVPAVRLEAGATGLNIDIVATVATATAAPGVGRGGGAYRWRTVSGQSMTGSRE